MTTQTNITTSAPHSALVMVISEIVAPVATIIASALISAFNQFSKPGKRRERLLSNAPAPHVAMVMVPGNFLTGPFLKR